MKKLKFLAIPLVLLMITIYSCRKKDHHECGGGPKGSCVCPANIEPVCGSDKKTYGNSCEAECAGVKKYTKGECSGF